MNDAERLELDTLRIVHTDTAVRLRLVTAEHNDLRAFIVGRAVLGLASVRTLEADGNPRQLLGMVQEILSLQERPTADQAVLEEQVASLRRELAAIEHALSSRLALAGVEPLARKVSFCCEENQRLTDERTALERQVAILEQANATLGEQLAGALKDYNALMARRLVEAAASEPEAEQPAAAEEAPSEPEPTG